MLENQIFWLFQELGPDDGCCSVDGRAAILKIITHATTCKQAAVVIHQWATGRKGPGVRLGST